MQKSKERFSSYEITTTLKDGSTQAYLIHANRSMSSEDFGATPSQRACRKIATITAAEDMALTQVREFYAGTRGSVPIDAEKVFQILILEFGLEVPHSVATRLVDAKGDYTRLIDVLDIVFAPKTWNYFYRDAKLLLANALMLDSPENNAKWVEAKAYLSQEPTVATEA